MTNKDMHLVNSFKNTLKTFSFDYRRNNKLKEIRRGFAVSELKDETAQESRMQKGDEHSEIKMK